jgi:hypothetical protein
MNEKNNNNNTILSDKIRHDLQLYTHIPDKKTRHDERYDPNTYVSIQSKVNSDSEFEKKYISKLAVDGWVALNNIKDIFLFPKGKPFKYRLNGDSLSSAPEGTFRSGGWFIGKNLDNPENNDKYIMYKGYNGVIFSLQIKDILEVYIKSTKREISTFKKPASITKYPIYLIDNLTKKKVVVYYARDKFAQNRFENSYKYKLALATGQWSWSAVFNNDI